MKKKIKDREEENRTLKISILEQALMPDKVQNLVKCLTGLQMVVEMMGGDYHIVRKGQ